MKRVDWAGSKTNSCNSKTEVDIEAASVMQHYKVYVEMGNDTNMDARCYVVVITDLGVNPN